MLKTNERIIDGGALKESVDKVLENSQRQPIVILNNGKPKSIILGVEQFDSMLQEINQLERKLLELSIKIADAQFGKGRFKSLDEAKAILENEWKTNLPDDKPES